jgi:hypothetical protein
MKLSGEMKVVQLHPKYGIADLTVKEFPMLYAFWKLNLTLSNTAQSAPGCASQKTKEEWGVLEDAMMEDMPANTFVMLALGLGDTEDPAMHDNLDHIFEEHFPGWLKDWF